MQTLYEQYRPQSLAEVVGQERAVKRLQTVAQRGLVGRVFWFTGGSGRGKTTMARIVAREVADEFATVELDALDLNLDTVRDWQRRCSIRPLAGQGWAFIVNEAHGLSSKVVSRLQTVLEDPVVQRTSTWCFTTTPSGQAKLFDGVMDACPFLSRAIVIALDEIGPPMVRAFAERARAIAVQEGLDGRPIEAYLDLASECRCNLRQMLNRIEAGEML